MDGLEERLTEIGVLFTLVLARIGAVVGTAPLLSEGSLPLRVKALMAVAIAGLITPLTVDSVDGSRLLEADTLLTYGALAAGEVVIGVALGLGVTIILAGVQMTGQIVGQMSGMALAEGVDPVFGNNSTVFGQIFYFTATAVFVAMGGHLVLIEGILDTLEAVPPGSAVFSEGLGKTFIGLMSVSFEVGIRSAAPLMVALFLATLVLGLISRTLPQINTIVVGFGVNAMFTIGVMMVAIGTVAWAFQAPIGNAIDSLVDSIVNPDAAQLTTPPAPSVPVPST